MEKKYIFLKKLAHSNNASSEKACE